MNRLVVLFALLFTANFSNSQKVNEITWFGIDFSKAKMIGSSGFNDVEKIQNYYLDTWNGVIVTEQDKYKISRYYKVAKVNISLDAVKESNSKVDAATLVVNNEYTLSESDAKEVVSGYVGKGSGMGLLYIVEYFSKTDEKASIYVVKFDIESGTISSIEKIVGKPGGFGFRNYWLGAILEVMKKG